MNATFKLLYRVFYTFDASELRNIQKKGPLLLISNHTNVFDGPLLYVFMQPSSVLAMAKKELWNHWFTAMVMKSWSSIPVDRENMTRETMEACFTALKEEKILAIAPEGTRSKDGSLQEGKAGVAFIAYKAQVPILPVITLGYNNLKENVKKFRRTPLVIKVGTPFEIIQKSGRLDAAARSELNDEIMLRLAALLPEDKRGFYSGKEKEYSLTKDIELPK
ncbi:MAG: 1-acyl-sn-glycerol-3-phosphate acyltransferase [Spirochaetia bacterium]|nr:1-acyl-sn-glycerol-3-phosphate acyltransferase [Spirochaetia bacterium]